MILPRSCEGLGMMLESPEDYDVVLVNVEHDLLHILMISSSMSHSMLTMFLFRDLP